jgi:GDP-L-fucose synthase
MARVLVAGSRGFIGRNLCEKLRREDHEALESGVDYTNLAEVESVVRDMDFVFVCCAKSYNGFVAKENPLCMVMPNLNMLSNILESSLKHNVKKVVYISSSTVYQPYKDTLKEKELDLNINPYNCYMGVGWMKRYAEKLCELYASLGLNVVVVRPTNIYGKWDKTDPNRCHVIPAFIMQALALSNPFIIYGDGKAVKDVIHIDDFIRDLLLVAKLHDSPDPINLCSGRAYSINELANGITKMVGYDPKFAYFRTNVEQVPVRKISNKKFFDLAGKQEYLTFEEGLERTLPFYC